jgi:glycosyltransferase involved in cell wall biosynthesis
LPLLLHGIGGQTESVVHGKEGFMGYTYDEIKNYLGYLLKDENVRRKMGKNARERCLKLDCSIMAKQYESMYKKLLY